MPERQRISTIAEQEEFLASALAFSAGDDERHGWSVEELEQRQLNAIERNLGAIGRWQVTWIVIGSLFQAVWIVHFIAFMFQTTAKEFWCTPPDHFTDAEASTWRNLSRHQTDPCTTPNMGANYPPPAACTAYEFAADGAITLIEEFELVCERKQLLSMVEMCFLAGAAAGSVTSGWISDRYGRKQVLMIFALIQTIFGLSLYLSESLTFYMTMRVGLGFASMTVGVVSFVLVIELVCGRWRTIIGMLNILPVPLTYVLTAATAYYIRDWRLLQVVCTMPGLFLLLIWYCVPESPRWLLARGRLTPLYKLVERAARMNCRTLSPNYKKSLEAVAPPPPISRTTTTDSGIAGMVDAGAGNAEAGRQAMASTTKTDSPLLVVFGREYWLITCLSFLMWLIFVVVYFGLTLHLSNLGGDIYMNTAIVGCIEAVSIVLSVFFVLKFGLRRNIVFYMLVPGICCLATNLVPHSGENGSHSPGIIALAMIAKVLIGANNAIIPTFTAMQYPTVVRNFGVGIGNFGAGVGLILVPCVWMLEHVEPLLPMSVLGISAIVGTVAIMFMKDVKE